MVIKEVKAEQRIEKKGDGFRYYSQSEYSLEAEDLLKMAQNEKVKIAEGTKTISTTKQAMRKANDFLSLNKKIIEAAQTIEKERFCQKCGMDFTIEANKSLRTNKTTDIYKVLCKNCAAKEGV